MDIKVYRFINSHAMYSDYFFIEKPFVMIL